MNLDLSLTLGIVGLVLTIYSIYLVIRKKKYPGRLTIIKENAVGLFNELAQNFEEIRIEFKNAPINKNIIYIKASIINNGEDDINLNNSEIPVVLKLPQGLKWIQSKITNSSKNVVSTTQIKDENELIVSCGLLRINEFFQFEALIETTDSKYHSGNIFKQISPHHRISNTQKISITSYLSEKERQRKLTNIKGHLIYIGVFFLFVLGLTAHKAFFPASTKFEYFKANKKYQASALTNYMVEVEDVESGEEVVITIDDFYRHYVPSIPRKDFWDYLLDSGWFLLAMVSLYIILAMLEYIELRKSRQLISIIEKQEK